MFLDHFCRNSFFIIFSILNCKWQIWERNRPFFVLWYFDPQGRRWNQILNNYGIFWKYNFLKHVFRLNFAFLFLELTESFKIRHSCRRSFVIIPQLASMSFHHSYTDGKILQLVAVDSIQVISLLKPNWFLERGLGKKYRQWLRPWKSSKQCQDFQPNDSVSNSLKFNQMRL